MKKRFVLFLALLSSVLLHSQESRFAAGFQTGLTQSKLVNKVSDFSNYPIDPTLGISAGLTLQQQLHERIHLHYGLFFSRLGYHENINDLRWGTDHDGNGGFEPDPDAPHTLQLRHHFHYLDAQVGAKVYLNPNAAVRLVIFPYLEGNILLRAGKNSVFVYDDGREEDTNYERLDLVYYRSYNISTGFGLGLEAPLGRRISLSLMPQVEYMLLGIGSAENGSRFLQLGGTLGLQYQL